MRVYERYKEGAYILHIQGVTKKDFFGVSWSDILILSF